jgi:PKD repeat protein
VNFATADGTAHGGSLSPNTLYDYQSYSGTTGFSPGSTTQYVWIPIYGDTNFEGNETFTLNLSQPVNATLARAQATCTIADDDPQPVISIGDVTVTSSTFAGGTSGGGQNPVYAYFPVTLSNGAGAGVVINFSTANGTAVAGTHYQALINYNLAISPGVTQAVIPVLIYGNPYWAPDKTFTLTLSNPSVGTLTRATGTCTIHSPLPMPTMSVSNVTVQAPTSGTTTATFTVSLSAPVSDPFQVYYTTADGTARAGLDYTAASGYLSFAAGQASASVVVTVAGDPVYDVDKTFNLNLLPLSAGGGAAPFASGTATIQSTAPPPTVSIRGVIVTDVDEGTTPAQFYVWLEGGTQAPLTVDYTTVDDTAVAGTDYVAKSGTLTFAPGQYSQYVTVDVIGTDVYQPGRTFSVVLSNPQNATIGLQGGFGTIFDDAPVAVAGPDQTVNEGDTVQLDASASHYLDGDPLTYTWDFGDGSSGTGVQPTHVYADNGVYTATVSVSDGSAVTTATTTVTVLNVAPTAAVFGPGGAVPYETIPVVVVATDPSPVDQASSFTYSVDWGDGTTQTVPWNYSVVGLSHAYTATGTYTVTATATDKDGATGPVGQTTVTVVTAQLQNGDLYVGGTPGDDNIYVQPGDANGGVEVIYNGHSLGVFAPTGQIVVYGGAGNDTIDVLYPYSAYPQLSLPVAFFGGDGDDFLYADLTTGPAVLVGGAGNDTLYGGNSGGRNVLIGGTGWDQIYGHWGDDILIGGTTAYDDNLAGLAYIRTQWARTDLDVATRVAQMSGAIPGGNYILNNQSVFSDGAGNFLYGSDGSDWFFQAGGTSPDYVFDLHPEDYVTTL